MSFGKAIHKNVVAKEAIDAYNDALFEYSAACRKYSRLRIIAEDSAASMVDIVNHVHGKKEYKEACKKYNKARNEFMILVNKARMGMPSLTDREGFDSMERISLEDTKKMREQSVIAEEIESGKYDELIAQIAPGFHGPGKTKNTYLNSGKPADPFFDEEIAALAKKPTD